MESSTVRLFSYFLVEYRLANREKNTNERGTRPCKGKTEKNVRRFIPDVRRIISDDYESSLTIDQKSGEIGFITCTQFASYRFTIYDYDLK